MSKGKKEKDMTRLSVTLAEAEGMTGISRWTLRREINRKKIRASRIGSRIVIPVSEIERITSSEPRTVGLTAEKE